jgi:uncharacterized membrane protein
MLMKTQKLTLYRIILTIILASTFLYAVIVGDSILLVISILTGFVLTIILAQKQEKIIADERIQLINEKASTTTVSAFVILATLLGFTLVGLDYIGYADLSQLGFNLMFAACALMVLHMLFRIYYRHKYGG